MNPPGVKESLELSNQYGISNVLVIILTLFFIGLMVAVIRWVFKTMETLMTTSHKEKIAIADILNTSIKSINESINQNTLVCQTIMQSARDGFDRMAVADGYHRQDIKELMALVAAGHTKAEDAREKLANAINTGCKVKL